MATLIDQLGIFPRPVEDSTILKCASCIPWLGGFIAWWPLDSLSDEIRGFLFSEFQFSRPRVIQLINLRNEYYVAGVIRNLLQIALVVTLIALGVLGGVEGALWCVLSIGLLGLHVYCIHQNQKIVYAFTG